MILLDVPYSQKDEAKKLGAFWNPNIKKWIAPNPKKYHLFEKWIKDYRYYNHVVLNHVYIVEAKRRCWRCKKINSIIGLGYDNYLITSNNWIKNNFYQAPIYCIDEKSPIFPLVEPFNCKTTYSNTEKDYYFGNCCKYCNALHGRFFLEHEPSSPFNAYNEQKAKKLKLYKYKLEFDLPIQNSSYSSKDSFVLEYARHGNDF